jgi:DNA-binding transcriptional LysR family regulator
MVVREYRQRYAGTQLVIEATQPDGLAADLADGAIDVGLTWDYDFAPRALDSLDRTRLLEDPLCLLLPAGHRLADVPGPVRLADVAAEPWVARSHRPPYDDALEVMCRIAGFEPDIVFRTADYQSIQGLVAAGVGVAVAPHLSVTALRSDVVVRPFHEPAFTRRVDALVLPESRRAPLIRPLLDVLRSVSEQAAAAAERFAAADRPPRTPNGSGK